MGEACLKALPILVSYIKQSQHKLNVKIPMGGFNLFHVMQQVHEEKNHGFSVLVPFFKYSQ